MHFKNGREAKDGDSVVGKSSYGGGVNAGRIVDLESNPEQTTCNCTVARQLGADLTCQTVGDYYHIEDAFEAMENAQAAANTAALAPAPVAMPPESGLTP